jgi:hypothetical protein
MASAAYTAIFRSALESVVIPLPAEVTRTTKIMTKWRFAASLAKSIDTNCGIYKLEKNYSLYALHKRSNDALYF